MTLGSDTVLDRSFSDALRAGGWWVTVYADASMDTGDPQGVAAARRRAVRDTLEQRGLPEDQLSVVSDAIDGTDGVPSPATRYLLLRDGEIVMNRLLPGPPVGTEVTEAGPVPLLVPLLRHQEDEIVYLVVEAGRDGGEVAVYRSTGEAPEQTEAVQGRTDTLKKFKGGGWAHLRFQHHTEEIWRQTEAELGAVVDRLVLELNPRFIAVAGDVRARQLLVDQLPQRSRDLVTQVDANTRAAGASSEALDATVENLLDEIARSAQNADMERLAQELGRDGGAAERGVGWTVHCLRQAQVDVLLLDPDQLGERTLLALGAEPWVATAPEEAGPAPILGDVPAAEALIRAAILTDASVRLVPGTLLPDRSGVAGLLRWGTEAPTGG
jgi:hypothetical protein